MDLQLEGKKAIVTGASRGIGKAIARALAMEGCDVAICARTEGPLAEAARELQQATGRRIVPIVADTLDAASIQEFVRQAAESLDGIEIVINNAARLGGAPGNIESVNDAEVLRDFEEKVVGYLRITQAAVPHMKAAGWGRVINISGAAGRTPGVQVSGGIRNISTINLTKSMANQLGQYGINVNAIYPGQTRTEAADQRFKEEAQRSGRSVEDLLREHNQHNLIKHYVSAADIANVVTFLCSPLAISITGEAIAVNGGASVDVHV